MLDLLSSNLSLIALVVVSVVYVIGAFLILYHLIRFGVGRGPKIAAFVFFGGSMVLALLLMLSYYTL